MIGALSDPDASVRFHAVNHLGRLRQFTDRDTFERMQCLSRYQEIRELLRYTDVAMPDSPADLREWSIVMAFTGVLNALDRGLIDLSEIIVHGSGLFSTGDYTPLEGAIVKCCGFGIEE